MKSHILFQTPDHDVYSDFRFALYAKQCIKENASLSVSTLIKVIIINYYCTQINMRSHKNKCSIQFYLSRRSVLFHSKQSLKNPKG